MKLTLRTSIMIYLNMLTASEDELINFYTWKKKEDVYTNEFEDAQFIKISHNIVAKCGYAVSSSEAGMQQFACNNVNQDIFRIPKVYRFFQDESE